MTTSKRIYQGELMGKYWEAVLLGSRYEENELVRRLLKDDSVLDVGCGPGSHTAYLSKEKHVIGIDTNRYFIKRAKQECKNKGNYENVDLIMADMTKLPFQSGVVDNVINIISLGFFSDEENESVLTETVRVLKKYGKYLQQNYYYPRSKRPLNWVDEYIKAPKGFSVEKRKKYDPKTKRVHSVGTVEYLRTGEKIDLDEETRIFYLYELKKLLKKNGLKKIRVYGSLVLKDLDLEYREFDSKKFGLMTIVSEK
jgi:ubiquinone/menaquinone biosynthesis C-methylase UbiE